MPGGEIEKEALVSTRLVDASTVVSAVSKDWAELAETSGKVEKVG